MIFANVVQLNKIKGPKMTPQDAAYKKLLRHAIGLCMAIYELVTGKEPPKWQDILK